MRFAHKKSHRSDFEIVVTSMLDINFLLIMFFMLTAQFQRSSDVQRMMEVTLEELSRALGARRARARLTVQTDGNGSEAE